LSGWRGSGIAKERRRNEASRAARTSARDGSLAYPTPCEHHDLLPKPFYAETWDAFRRHGAQISGFRERYDRLARERIKVGDILLCYLVGLSRWCGALEVMSEPFRDGAPIFSDPDPYVVRFRVRPVVALDPEMSPPIFEAAVWDRLSETKGIEKGARGWATRFRGSLRRMMDADGALLLDVLRKQKEVQTRYPLTERDRRLLARKRTVTTLTGEVEVEVPDAQEDAEAAPVTPSQSAARWRRQRAKPASPFRCRPSSPASAPRWASAFGFPPMTALGFSNSSRQTFAPHSSPPFR
jgi:hypothetical protein